MHTHYPKGTPLFIQLKDGTIIRGKFLDHKSGCVLLDKKRRVNITDVKSMSQRNPRDAINSV